MTADSLESIEAQLDATLQEVRNALSTYDEVSYDKQKESFGSLGAVGSWSGMSHIVPLTRDGDRHSYTFDESDENPFLAKHQIPLSPRDNNIMIRGLSVFEQTGEDLNEEITFSKKEELERESPKKPTELERESPKKPTGHEVVERQNRRQLTIEKAMAIEILSRPQRNVESMHTRGAEVSKRRVLAARKRVLATAPPPEIHITVPQHPKTIEIPPSAAESMTMTRQKKKKKIEIPPSAAESMTMDSCNTLESMSVEDFTVTSKPPFIGLKALPVHGAQYLDKLREEFRKAKVSAAPIVGQGFGLPIPREPLPMPNTGVLDLSSNEASDNPMAVPQYIAADQLPKELLWKQELEKLSRAADLKAARDTEAFTSRCDDVTKNMNRSSNHKRKRIRNITSS